MKRLWGTCCGNGARVGRGCGVRRRVLGGGGGGGGTIKVALGDIESVETLALFIALERVRERGIEVELTELADEDLANQAVVGGQADVGLGAPYGLIQGSERAAADLLPAGSACASSPSSTRPPTPTGSRSTARPSPCTRAARRPRRSRRSSSRRKASSSARSATCRAPRCVRLRCCGEHQGGGARHPEQELRHEGSARKFHVLPVPETNASDEVLFGNTEWLEQNKETVQVLLEEVLTTWRSINEDPQVRPGRSASGSGLLKDLPAELEEELLPYYQEASEERLVHPRLRRRGSRAGRLRVLQLRRPAQGRPGGPEGRGLLDASTRLKKAVKTVEGSGLRLTRGFNSVSPDGAR